MNYNQVLEDMFNKLPIYSRIGAPAYKADLSNTLELCKFTEHPEKNLRCIHIAGTNGKGSVANMIASIFQEAGYKTGLYTSPHLKDFRERIRINGKKIPQKDVIKYYHNIIEKANKIQSSFFEMTVVMAFVHFRDHDTDIAIIETGLGGRLDSTNVIVPNLSIITNIGMDHQGFLGNTIKDIAIEKAGIIKPNIPVVIGQYHPETASVFIQKSKTENSPIYFSKDFNNKVDLVQQQYFTINGEKVFCPLLGEYQIENINTVLAAMTTFSQYYKDLVVTDKNIKDGLERVVKNSDFKGRWQIIQLQPKVIIDVGHNEDGIKNIIRQIQQEQFKHLRIIYGAVNDKSVSNILKLFPIQNTSYYLTEPPVPRKLPLADLKEIVENKGLPVVYSNIYPNKVYNRALADAEAEDLILVLGSSFIVGEIL